MKTLIQTIVLLVALFSSNLNAQHTSCSIADHPFPSCDCYSYNIYCNDTAFPNRAVSTNTTSFTWIQEVHFLNLRSLPNNAFTSLSINKLVLHAVEVISRDSFKDTASLATLVISSPRLASIEKGAFLPLGGKLSTLKLKNVAKRRLESSWKEIQNLKSLSTLILNNNGLKSFDSARRLSTFSNLNTLKVVNQNFLTNNFQIAGPSSLTTLILHSNQIRKVKSDNIKSLPSLQTLDLHDNSIASFEFDKNLASLTSLTTLDLSMNKIAWLATNTSSYSLVNLNLSSNFLFRKLDLTGFSRLSVLDLSINTLSEKSRIALPASLAHLALKLNSFTSNFTASSWLGQSAQSISTLDLSYNMVESIEQATFAGMLQIQTLILRGNMIRNIDPACFESNSMLSQLDLSWNMMNEDVLLGLNSSSLILLDLSYNHLTKIGKNEFSMLPNLITLSMAHSSLESIGTKAFAANNRLSNLYLNDNMLSKFGSLLNNGSSNFFIDMRNQNGMFTSLVEFQFDQANFKQNTTLNINLNGNEIRYLDDHAFCFRGAAPGTFYVYIHDLNVFEGAKRCVLKQLGSTAIIYTAQKLSCSMSQFVKSNGIQVLSDSSYNNWNIISLDSDSASLSFYDSDNEYGEDGYNYFLSGNTTLDSNDIQRGNCTFFEDKFAEECSATDEYTCPQNIWTDTNTTTAVPSYNNYTTTSAPIQNGKNMFEECLNFIKSRQESCSSPVYYNFF
jgi:Leucine-rich repeat (LRR) protein